MSSFIFSFRSIALALVLIALTEGVCALALKPSIVERTKFNLLDRFHSSVIFGKLDEFADSSPDILQVGDSSGFHGVRPDVVMRYLGGLKYVNLSCCAGMGYRGYYGIADFMLRRNPGIKAVVLYVGLTNLPRTDLIEGQHQLGTFIEDSLTTPFAYLSPATVALRQRIVDAMERKDQARIDAAFTEDMRTETRAHNGWWAEHDRRLASDKRLDYWRHTCGENGVAVVNDREVFYGSDPIRGRESYMVTELRRFAVLTAHHGAKLIVLIHPYPCRALEGDFIEARREDVRALMKGHSNLIVLPEGLVELWPSEKFVALEHLRVGYDVENSRRVGKLLAKALGLNLGAEESDVTGGQAGEPIASSRGEAVPALSAWRADGATVRAEDNGAGFHLIEGAGPAPHGLEQSLTGLTPGTVLVLSVPAKPIGARGIYVELETAGRRGGGYCDLYGETAQRDGAMFDVGLEPEPSGWSRCWVAMPIDAPEATLRLSLMNERLDPAYIGNGTSGVAIGKVELRETTRFLAQEPSPW